MLLFVLSPSQSTHTTNSTARGPHGEPAARVPGHTEHAAREGTAGEVLLLSLRWVGADLHDLTTDNRINVKIKGASWSSKPWTCPW